MMRNIKTLVVVTLFLVTNCTNKDHLLNDVDIKKIVADYANSKNFSAIVSLKDSDIKKRDFYYKKGVSNSNGEEFEKESKFPIADLTTQFTAVALLKVIYQKYEAVHTSKSEILKEIKLVLDSPISLYLDNNKYWGSDKPNWLNQVTIHQLLTHTSGIVDTKNDSLFDSITKNFQDNSKKYSFINDNQNKFNFARTNYLLVSLIIEKLANKSFAEVIDQILFDKYKLTNTLNPELGTVKSLKNKSNYRGLVDHFSYNPFNNEPYKLNNNYSEYANLQGVSSVISNIEDLHTWNFALHEKKIVLDEDLYEIMTAKHVKYQGVYYGYGLAFYEQQNKKSFFNVGTLDNYTSLMVYSDNKSLVMLSNLGIDNKGVIEQAQKIRSTLAPFILDQDTQEISFMKEFFSKYNNNLSLTNLINRLSDLLLNKK